MSLQKIGVFDSGVGGESVAHAIIAAFPDVEVLFRDDKAHLPYGNKTPEQLVSYVLPILQEMLAEGCDVIVLACNTVSTMIFTELDSQIDCPLIAVEPMLAEAAEQTKAGVIAVCATPGTLNSARYAALKHENTANCTVIEPDCSDWAALIQDNSVNETHIREQIEPACSSGADVIVLGCTHYHWIEAAIAEIAGPDVVILQPEAKVVATIHSMLAQ